MNAKTAKLLRKIAPRMGETEEFVISAFKKLDPIQQIDFVKKAKDRLKHYDQRKHEEAVA